MMGALFQDVRYGVRMLAKNPGFTAVAVLTLALGIGANTAMFSVVNGVLLRPLPYPQADRIVQILRTYRGQPEIDTSGSSSSQFTFWKSHGDPFQYLAANTPVGFNLAGGSRPERVRALRVSMEYFHVLGIQPVLGRDFLPDEDRLGGPNVAILSEGLWKRDFGADGQVTGRFILLDGVPYTVVGVMPSGFESVSPVDLWTTIGQVAQTIGSGGNYEVIGRLKPNVSRKQADSFLATLTKPYLTEFEPRISGNEAKEISFGAFSYQYVVTSEHRGSLLVLFGAVGFVLLIACVNVANLQIGRAAARNREIAVRTALGAGRPRIFRQLLTENVLLAGVGAGLGLLFAYWCLGFLVALAPAGLPRAREISLDRWALAFAALVAVVTGILSGLGPAFQASRTDLNEFVKETGGRSSTRRQRLGAVLSAAEIALSLMLLVGSGLLIQTFANLLRANPGFDPRHILSLQIWTTGSRHNSGGGLASFYESTIRRIEAIPGVESAAVVAAGLPLEQGGNLPFRVERQKDSQWVSADYREITPDYFHTLGVPLLQGRLFAPADSQDANKVVIINAAFARKYFPDRNPIGEHLTLADAGHREIVGVVGEVKSFLDEPAEPSTFIPMAQASYRVDQLFQGWFPTCVLVRTAQKPLSVSRAVENALRDAAPNLPIGEVRSMEEVLSFSIAQQRFRMTLMTIFAGLALALAAVGIYGVISYSVSQRTHEIGVRMALGATRGIVLQMIVRQGLRLTLIGTALGLLGALGLTRVLKSMLFGVKPTDPVTFVAVSMLLAAVALLASYIPARRATKVDPMVALRYE
jgi:putative ABC transport system permease protein